MLIKALFISIILRSSALSVGGPQAPIFEWTDNQERSGGSPTSLKIHFPDGGHDVIQFDKIRQLSSDEDPSCIMSGAFVEDPSVKVTLTGGCHKTQDFEITIVGSDRLEHSTFKVTEGKAVSTDLLQNFDYSDPLEAPDTDRKKKAKPKGKVPRIAWLSVGLHADEEFVTNSKGIQKAQLIMNRILGHAQAWLSHPSLGVEIILETVTPENWLINGSIYSDSKTLHWASRLNRTQFNSTALVNVEAYFGMGSLFQRSWGKAYYDSACGSEKRFMRAIIVEHWHLESTTGKVFAHEIGHTLGIRHDYYKWKLSFRYDANNFLCTFRGGVMDYSEIRYKRWSTCSKQDLIHSFESNILYCLRGIFVD